MMLTERVCGLHTALVSGEGGGWKTTADQTFLETVWVICCSEVMLLQNVFWSNPLKLPAPALSPHVNEKHHNAYTSFTHQWHDALH